MKLSFKINGFTQEQPFVVVDTDIDFIILGMPFISTLTSINMRNNTIYSGKARFPFVKSRNDIEQLRKRQEAALIIYALNEDSYITEVPIYNINNAKQTEVPSEPEIDLDMIKLQENLADRLSHIENQEHSSLIFDEFLENIEALSKNKADIGTFNGPIKATITLNDDTPVFEQLRPQPYGYRDILREHEQKMIELGIVQEGLSDWRFNMVLAKKKDFGQKNLSAADLLRPCTDFRILNNKTQNDPTPIPNMQEIIDGMVGKKYFSHFDLTSAYWAILMDENSKKYTAFVSQDGITLVYNRLSFGLKNAPSIFTRAMSWTLDPLRKYGIFNFMDDVIIATETIEEHVLALRMFLRRMKETGWKIKLEKSTILVNEVKFLGYVVSAEGIKPDPERVKLYAEWERPKNPRQLVSFLQSLQYYKRFIKGFSLISAPLYELTRKDGEYLWKDVHEEAFKALKDRIINHVNLQYPKVNEPYRLTTDWQPAAISYVLEQEDESELWQPIAFGGKKMSKSESNYSSYDGEIVAGYYAFNNLSKYLRNASLTGTPNIWQTDNRALEYARSRREIYGRLARILMYLEGFNFIVKHIPGKENPADPLSRIEEKEERSEEEWKRIEDMKDDHESHPFLMTLETLEEWVGEGENLKGEEEEAFYFTQEVLEDLAQGDDEVDLEELAEEYEEVDLHVADMAREQDKDEEIKRMKHHLSGERELTSEEVRARGKKMRSLFEKKDRMVVHDNVLKVTRREDVTGLERTLVIVPDHLTGQVIHEFHERGHYGEKKLRLTILQHAWFYEMSRKVRDAIATCEVCQARKGPGREYRLELKSQQAGFFNEKVVIDLITMRPSSSGCTRGLSIVDVWSGFGTCIALKGGTTKEVAEALMNEWICKHSVMNEIQSDRGPEFASGLMKELCEVLKVEKIESAPWSPFSAGKCEKFNRTVKDALAKELGGASNEWDKLLPAVCFYYNVTTNLTTNVSPFELATGRLPVLPISLTLDRRNEEKMQNEYITELIDRMTEVSRAVYESTRRNQAAQQREFNKRLHGAPLNVGDLVRVRYHGPAPEGMTTKLMLRWRGPFQIVEKLGDRTYVVRMPYRGRMMPRVQNIRNLYKVGRVSTEEDEEELGMEKLWSEGPQENDDELAQTADVEGAVAEGSRHVVENDDADGAVDEDSGRNENDSDRERQTVTTRSGRVVRAPERFNT